MTEDRHFKWSSKPLCITCTWVWTHVHATVADKQYTVVLGTLPIFSKINRKVATPNKNKPFQQINYFNKQTKGPRWQSGNTLASHLWGRGSVPYPTSSGKAGSCLLLVGSLQLQKPWHTNCMYWFPLPFQLPIVIWPVQCWKRRKTPNK